MMGTLNCLSPPKQSRTVCRGAASWEGSIPQALTYALMQASKRRLPLPCPSEFALLPLKNTFNLLRGRLTLLGTLLNLREKLDGTRPYPPYPVATWRILCGRPISKKEPLSHYRVQYFITVPSATRLSPRRGARSREWTLMLNTDAVSVARPLLLSPGRANVDPNGIPVCSTEEPTC